MLRITDIVPATYNILIINEASLLMIKIIAEVTGVIRERREGKRPGVPASLAWLKRVLGSFQSHPL